jgi:hypothetical protein
LGAGNCPQSSVGNAHAHWGQRQQNSAQFSGRRCSLAIAADALRIRALIGAGHAAQALKVRVDRGRLLNSSRVRGPRVAKQRPKTKTRE